MVRAHLDLHQLSWSLPLGCARGFSANSDSGLLAPQPSHPFPLDPMSCSWHRGVHVPTSRSQVQAAAKSLCFLKPIFLACFVLGLGKEATGRAPYVTSFGRGHCHSGRSSLERSCGLPDVAQLVKGLGLALTSGYLSGKGTPCLFLCVLVKCLCPSLDRSGDHRTEADVLRQWVVGSRWDVCVSVTAHSWNVPSGIGVGREPGLRVLTLPPGSAPCFGILG